MTFNQLIAVMLLLPLTGNCFLLKFRNPKNITPKLRSETGENNTDGYLQDILPHAQNDDLENPVYKLKDLSERFLQLCIETIEDGASISCQDESAGPIVAVQGQGCHCWKPGADVLRFEFFCTDSCQTSDTDFHFRFIYSEKNPVQPDMWCSSLPSKGFPSDLRPDPIFNPEISTQTKKRSDTLKSNNINGGCTLRPSSFVLNVALILTFGVLIYLKK